MVTPSRYKLASILMNKHFSPVLEGNWQYHNALIIDLTAESRLWQDVQIGMNFEDVIAAKVKRLNARLTIGRYNEERVIYQDRDHFSNSTNRTLHIGIDLGAPAGLKILAPLDGIVHSFADNYQDGDYGPTMILQHELDGVIFHTLYGHLSRQSLEQKSPGMKISSGEVFATIGEFSENGGWAPHLHFQLIEDMQGYRGDYPGVVDPKHAEFYLANCPDPNLILKRSDL